MTTIQPRNWAQPWQEHGLPPAEWQTTGTIPWHTEHKTMNRPSTWGSSRKDISRGRTDDGQVGAQPSTQWG